MKNFNKTIAIKQENTYGNLSDTNIANIIPRNSLSLTENIETTVSNELNFNNQNNTLHYGNESVNLSIDSELRPNNFNTIISSLFGYSQYKGFLPFVTTCSISSYYNDYKITRSSGTFAVLKRYSIIRLTSGANAINLNKNLLIIAVESNYIIVRVLNNSVLIPEIDINTTIECVGNTSGYLTNNNVSFTAEILQNDTANKSEVYNGLVTNSVAVNLSNNSLPTISIQSIGKGLKQKSSTEYFSTYVAPNDNVLNNTYACIYVDNIRTAMQSASISLQRSTVQQFNTASNKVQVIKQGVFSAEVSCNIYVLDDTIYDKYRNQESVGLCFTLPFDQSDSSAFVSYSFNNCKIVSYEKNDDTSIIAAVKFKVLADDKDISVNIQDSSGVTILWNDPIIWNDSAIWYD